MNPLFEVFLAITTTALILTALVRLISKRVGFVSDPDGKRWNQRTVALGGGISIFLAISLAFIWKGNAVTLSIYPAFLAMFLLGLFDDLWGTTPSVKLIVQVICASYAVSKGFVAPFPWVIPGIAVTVVWIVGMTNSLNLIDNMDGLASGCTSIAALGMAVVLMAGTPSLPGEVMVLVSVSAATLGFLFHNFNPARIFMGDAGSLPLGFLLAVLSTRMKLLRPEVSTLFSVVLILLILIVPLLDTFLVIISRRSAKRSITIGGRDHTSHRLVALGLSERKAVMVLYAFGALGALSAYLALPSSLTGVLTVFSVMAILVVLFGLFLLEIAVYPAVLEGTTKKGKEPFPIHIQYLIEIALDVGAVSACWLAAHLIRFHDTGIHYYREYSVIPFLPFVITTKLVALLLFRLYQGIWRSISPRDIYQIFKASVLGSTMLALGLMFTTRLIDISRVVLLVDGLLCFLALVATRTALIAFRRWTRRIASRKYNAIYLGDASFLPWVEEALQTERGLLLKGVVTSGVDAKLGERLLGSPDELEKIVKQNEIDVVITTQNLDQDVLEKMIPNGLIVRRIKPQLT